MSTPISRRGFNRLLEELEQLKKGRPVIARIIQEAREEGDLSENAAYDAARERQGLQEARISYLESRLPILNVIDFSRLNGDKITYGAKVTLLDQDTEEEKSYTLLGPDETGMVKGAISVESPVARALLGKKVGEEVMVDVPKGKVYYEITELSFPGEGMFGD